MRNFLGRCRTWVEVKELVASTHRALTHAVYGFFKNGGTRCFVRRIKNDIDKSKGRLDVFESIDAVAIIAAPGLDGQAILGYSLSHIVRNCEDRFAILDCPAKDEDNDGDLDVN